MRQDILNMISDQSCKYCQFGRCTKISYSTGNVTTNPPCSQEFCPLLKEIDVKYYNGASNL